MFLLMLCKGMLIHTRTTRSCSHTFHKKCIEAFERFNIYEVCLCPVCRDDYTKIDVFNVKQMSLGDGRFFVD